MRWLLIIAASLSTSMRGDVSATHREAAQAGGGPRATGALAGVDQALAVVVSLDDSRGAKVESAVWVDDAAAPPLTANVRGSIVIVQPRGDAVAPPPPARSKPGDAPFTGMSFNPIFEND